VRIPLVAAALLALAAAAPAQATFPGANGKLAVSVDTCEFHPHLRAIGFDGRHLGMLTEPCEALGLDEDEEPTLRSAQAPEWSPDGQRLLFAQSGAEPAGLYTMAADGSGHRLVTTADVTQPSFSPDGNRIAFVRGDAVWTMASDGTGQRRLRAGPRCARANDCVELDEPRWSPDGRVIAVRAEQLTYGRGRRASPRPGLWLISATTGRFLRRVVPTDAHGHAPSAPDWSPDGRRLVYGTAFGQDEVKGGASGGNLYVVDRSGRNRRRIVHRRRLAETHPVWSPDGRYIAWIGLDYSSGDVGFRLRPALMRIALRGGRPKLLRKLPQPYVEEGYHHIPELSWQPLPAPAPRLARSSRGGS
jgi:TolB protein